jgi:flagellar FliL protein
VLIRNRPGIKIAYIRGMAEQVQETVAVPAKKSGKLVYILVAVLVLGAASGGGFFWLRHHKSVPPAEHPRVTTVMHLETFVVNLADEDQHTFLRVGIDLGIAGESKKAKEGEGEQPAAPIRDVILSVLMATHSTDLATIEGKHKLKEQLLQKLNEHLPALHAQEIYFTEYLLQR